MHSSKELLKVYETILKSPGMNESVKMSVKVSRRDVLLLCQIVERGMAAADAKEYIPREAIEGLKNFTNEFLSKGEFSEEFISSFKELMNVKHAEEKR